jgi:hypothetical protein
MEWRESLSPAARELRRMMGEAAQEVFRPRPVLLREASPPAAATGDDAPEASPPPPPAAEASDADE